MIFRAQHFVRFFLTAGMAFFAAPAWAEEAAEKGGLPQFDVALFPGQLFWLAVSFGFLYLLMAFVALPGVGRTQARRKQVIAEEVAAASTANEAAKVTLAQYEKALAGARAKAQESVNGIAMQAAKESAEQQAAQQQELAKRLYEAEAKIGAARDAALRNVQSAAAELAGAIVEKVTGQRAQA